ncbi:hypothetical protein HHK36_019799 [Tetracentron sinense]|uniref:Uncharacterized protein n=1 Tax=Tetracentron sinense TaxID=13715 RepID=A0A834YY01_TETSI|nr:hypothetical protein HHK36_019799 [Tetracentron sinense]
MAEQDANHEVFTCLRLSYDYLKGEETKACFLLCYLFPEDHQIEIEDLARYGRGQRLFQDVDTMEEARGRAHTSIKNLKASCLLLDGFKKDFVKMHDDVRHVAKTFASKDKHVLVRACMCSKDWPNKETFEHDTEISLTDNNIFELPLGCRSLKTIPPNVILSLSQLEELDMADGFAQWEAVKEEVLALLS